MKGVAPRGELARFLEKISPEPNSGCWLWLGALQPSGYGALNVGHHRAGLAHRIAWQLFVGPIPDGAELDHLCRVRCCANPAHLEVVTPYENWRRGESVTARRKRMVACTRGHEYTPTNTRRDKKGHRHCMTCDRWHAAESRRRRAEAAA